MDFLNKTCTREITKEKIYSQNRLNENELLLNAKMLRHRYTHTNKANKNWGKQSHTMKN